MRKNCIINKIIENAHTGHKFIIIQGVYKNTLHKTYIYYMCGT